MKKDDPVIGIIIKTIAPDIHLRQCARARAPGVGAPAQDPEPRTECCRGHRIVLGQDDLEGDLAQRHLGNQTSQTGRSPSGSGKRLGKIAALGKDYDIASFGDTVLESADFFCCRYAGPLETFSQCNVACVFIAALAQLAAKLDIESLSLAMRLLANAGARCTRRTKDVETRPAHSGPSFRHRWRHRQTPNPHPP